MENSVFDQFKAVRVYKEAGKPSLHKPVLLLYALSQCYQGQNRLIPFSVVDRFWILEILMKIMNVKFTMIVLVNKFKGEQDAD